MDLVLRLLQQPMLQLLFLCFSLATLFYRRSLLHFGNFPRKMVQRDFCEWIWASTLAGMAREAQSQSLNRKWDEKKLCKDKNKTRSMQNSENLQLICKCHSRREKNGEQGISCWNIFYLALEECTQWRQSRESRAQQEVFFNRLQSQWDVWKKSEGKLLSSASFYWEMIEEIWIMIFTLMMDHQSIIRANCWRLIAEPGAVYCFNERFVEPTWWCRF